MASFKYLFILYGFTFVFYNNASFAQIEQFKCESTGLNDGKAKNLLQKTQAAYSQLDNFTAKFKQQSYLAALEESENSSGSVYFSKPGKMRWEYATPEEQTFLVINETVWFYQKAANQLMIDIFSKLLLTDAPVGFLMGLGDLVNSFELVTGCNTKAGIVLELKEKSTDSSESNLGKFKLLVDKKNYLPLGAQIKDVGGNLNTIVFEELKSGKSIGDEVFKVDFPKGVDVQDRRREG